MLVALTRLRQAFVHMFASTQLEATHDPIAYHGDERDGEMRFSQSSSLRRHY
jgi:hypothetical protein